MTIRKMFLSAAAAGMICFIAGTRCCSDLAGGTSDVGNPEKITGVVVNAEQEGIGGVPLRLCKRDYYHGSDSAGPVNRPATAVDDPAFYDTTDNDGYFSFSRIPEGYYNLIGNSQEYLLHVYYGNISVDSGQARLDTISFREPGTVFVVIPDTVFSAGCNIVVLGTPIIYAVDSAGPVVLNVPSGRVKISCVNGSGELLTSVVDTSFKEIVEHDTLDLTNGPHVISRPALTVPDTVAVASALIANVCCARSSRFHPLEYRFWWNGELSDWSPDTVVTHVFTQRGYAVITVQARSRMDTLTVSQWSDSGLVRIVDTLYAPVITEQPRDTAILVGDSLYLSVTATGSPAPQYQWYHDSTIIPGAVSSQYLYPSVGLTESGFYSVHVSNSEGGLFSDRVTVSIH